MSATHGGTERHPTIVGRERVIAPPERFIHGLTDDDLISYWQGAFGSELAPAIPLLHQLIDGICSVDFTKLRRQLQSDYEYFGAAAEARSDVDLKPADTLDAQELRFLADFHRLMDASQYRRLTQTEWDAAQAEDFLFTLPCDVKWDAMDDEMLRRYWAAFPEERASAPAETADRILVFQRGAGVASMQGSYYMLKVNLLISMWLLQPLYAVFVAIMSKLGVRRFVPDAPKGLASTSSDADDALAKAALERASRQALHAASTSIERRTFARVFPDGKTILKKLFKQVKLQEACFRDVVILYRTAVPDKLAPASEVDVIVDANPDFIKRNMVIKQFRGIPLADLEMIMPEKTVFVPPKVFVEMAVTLIGGLVAMVTAWMSTDEDGKGGSMAGIWTGLTLFGGRAAQVYSSAVAQKTLIENTMGKLLYERTVGSGAGVLTGLVDGVCRQRVREILICYCVLLNSQRPLTANELDEACERFLANQFGCKIDFCCEEALPAILKWGLASDAGGEGGALSAVSLPDALKRLDDVFDALYDFKGSTKAILKKAAGEGEAEAAEAAASPGLGGVALGRSLSRAQHSGSAALGSPSSSGKKKSLLKRIFH